MGSRVRFSFLPLLVSLSLLVVALAVVLPAPGGMAQSSEGDALTPDQLWSFTHGSEAPINDVAIDASGKVAGAVAGDGSATDFGDDELFLWDLARSPSSSSPAVQDDPNADPLDPEGLSVIAVEPRPGGKAELVAVGDEGDGDSTNHNIYVYSLLRGPDTARQANYGSDGAPAGPVEDLWFEESGNWLIAHHGGDPGAISLLERTGNTQFAERDRFNPPPGDELLQDVDVSDDRSRIIAATSASDAAQGSTIHLRVFERQGQDLVRITNPKTHDRSSAGAIVDLDGTGEYALLGTEDNTVFYYRIQDDNVTGDADADPDVELNFSAAWSTRGSSAITSLDLTPNGRTFAAGFADGPLVVFEQIDLPEDGPIAARAVKQPFDAASSVDQVIFADDGRRLYAVADTLYGFHARQFDPDKGLEPLWAVPGIERIDTSRGGERILASTGSSVSAYEHSYRAAIQVDAPDEIRPGETTQVPVEVNNTGSAFDAYELRVTQAPNTWTVGFDTSQVELLPGQGETVTLNVTPDVSQAPGEVTFRVEATSTRGPSGEAVGGQDVTVTIPEVRGAKLSTPDDRLEGTRGQTTVIDVDLSNAGNTNTSIRVQVTQDEDWSVAIAGQDGDSRTLQLDPGGERALAIGLAVPESAEEGSTNTVTISASPTSGGSGDEVTVDVIVEPSFGAAISGPTDDPIDVEPDSEHTFEVTVENTGNTPDTFRLTTFSNATNPEHLWRVTLDSTELTIGANESRTVSVTVNVPRAAVPGDAADVTIAARSDTTGDRVDEATFRLQVSEETDDAPLGVVVVPLAIGLAALGRRRNA